MGATKRAKGVMEIRNFFGSVYLTHWTVSPQPVTKAEAKQFAN